DQYRLYRTYHGCTMAPPVARASVALWDDDTTATRNRQLYDQKFAAFVAQLAPVWSLDTPPGAFYLWAKTPYDDVRFTRDLYARQNITVLPGSYLARTAHGSNPGSGWVRISLVADVEDCREAAHRILRFFETIDINIS
ncbi:MAG: aminotransferase class I/II-fold pyridoxal phosphate-dependent enzyme, partial [Gammaproteobacteria bacterium]|nr:aminotransferase class I/II-fold pyridoxal phosphate-dependent enzyme [Gammaproteobacteria bacterium]